MRAELCTFPLYTKVYILSLCFVSSFFTSPSSLTTVYDAYSCFPCSSKKAYKPYTWLGLRVPIPSSGEDSKYPLKGILIFSVFVVDVIIWNMCISSIYTRLIHMICVYDIHYIDRYMSISPKHVYVRYAPVKHVCPWGGHPGVGWTHRPKDDCFGLRGDGFP